MEEVVQGFFTCVGSGIIKYRFMTKILIFNTGYKVKIYIRSLFYLTIPRIRNVWLFWS